MRKLEKLLPLLLHREEDVEYFSNADTSGFLLITKNKKYLITADSYVKANAVIIESKDYYKDLFELFKKLRIKKAFACVDSMPFKMFSTLSKKVRLYDAEDKVDKIRSIKTKKEIKCIEKASRLSVRAMKAVKESIKKGVTEKEIYKTALCESITESEGIAFNFIISSGKNSLRIHSKPTDKKIKEDETIIVDLGFVVNNYCSDMTRTFCINPSKEKEEKWEIIKKAYKIALGKIKPGKKCNEAVIAVQSFFKEKGVLQYWKYSLGHGIGLRVHEEPVISLKSKQTFKNNMVIALEPGLHVQNIGGFRLENTLVINKSVKNLTKMNEEMRV